MIETSTIWESAPRLDSNYRENALAGMAALAIEWKAI